MSVTRIMIGGRYTNLETDSATNALNTIDTVHHEVHDGESYNISMYHTTVKPSVPFNAILKIGAKDCHTVFGCAGQSDTLITIYSGVGISTTTGLAQTPRNLNRNYADTSTATIYRQAKYTTTGTIIQRDLLPGTSTGTGATRASIGGQLRNTSEWIFKKNTKYMIQMQNMITTTKKISMSIQWYEH